MRKGIQAEERECAKCCRCKNNVYVGNGELSLGVAEGVECKKLKLNKILERESRLTG